MSERAAGSTIGENPDGRRTKVLYTATSYLPAVGGAQTHAHQTALRLQHEYAFQVVTLWDENRTDWLLGTTLGANRRTRTYEVDGIPVARLGFSLTEKLRMAPAVGLYYAIEGPSIHWLAGSLARKIAPYASSVGLIHNGRIGREPLSFASLRLARERDIPFILTPYHHPRWTGWLYRYFIDLYLRSDALIALTEAEKKLLAALGVDEEKIFVTGMAPVLADEADPARFRAELGVDGPIVLFLGQHFPYKGYQQLLQSAPVVLQEIPEAQFVFAGPDAGSSAQVFNAVEDDRVTRLGTVDLQTKTNALAACSLLCVPSTQESFGGVYTEAWAMGKPVIGCPIPSVSEVVEDAVDGILVDQGPEAIAAAILDLLQNPSEAERMGQRGREKVQSSYTWDRVAERTRRAYESVI